MHRNKLEYTRQTLLRKQYKSSAALVTIRPAEASAKENLSFPPGRCTGNGVGENLEDVGVHDVVAAGGVCEVIVNHFVDGVAVFIVGDVEHFVELQEDCETRSGRGETVPRRREAGTTASRLKFPGWLRRDGCYVQTPRVLPRELGKGWIGQSGAYGIELELGAGRGGTGGAI